ncbi:MAG: hypothetical protein HY482_01090 [Candidatus Wildermuthbacteria bacterium]|nr:hypothetical protein [Candidatus Wildermuthbacteria bacterium]
MAQEREEKKVLLLLDANSLIHRAFHALPPLTTSKGVMVNAVYGFLLALFRAIKEFNPDYIAAAFDVPSSTEGRKKKFLQYKAQREKAPDELYAQIPLVQAALKVLHIPVFEQAGFEADDIIATISRVAPLRQAHPPLETVIATGDADALQLVSGRIKVYALRKGVQDSVLYDEKAVREKYGADPRQLVDWKGLRGDPSDNIPGVKGVGEKTATLLIGEFGSLEDLYVALEARTDIPGISLKLKQTLLEGKESAFLSRDLATMSKDVPLDISLPELSWRGFNKSEAEEFLRSFEFKTLIPRLAELSGESSQTARGGEKEAIIKESVQSQADRLLKDGVLSEQIYELEIELDPVLRRMEDIGIAIDPVYFRALGKELEKDIAKLQDDIFKDTGGPFNISSPKQLSEVLFSRLGISPKGLHKTPGGAISTASSELEKISGESPAISLILSYRELAKLLTTYVAPLPLLADPNNRVHTSFDQFGAATGRFSSSRPNLQNIPMQGPWGERIRKGFVAAPGFQLVSFDYSQMELRLAAHMANEEKMIEAFEQGKDIHKETAAAVFGVPEARVDKEMRSRAKALNFGILYGMGARGFANSAKISLQEAQEFMDGYFLQFPAIAAYMEESVRFARENGFAETLFGRKRFLPDIYSSSPHIRAAAERVAINHGIQGTAADIMKMAMVLVSKAPGLLGGHCEMVLQIHDELLFEISDDMIQEKAAVIKEIMETARSFKVRLTVQAFAGKSWGEQAPLI